MKRNYLSKLLVFTIILCLFITASCDKKTSGDDDNNEQKETIINTTETYTILTGTIYETKVYKITSNVEGPRVAIVGGIHGDEIAGWGAALKLVTAEKYKSYFKGEVLIIPQANILACNLNLRYAGYGNKGVYNSVKYTDLNRSFPGNASGTATEQIAYAISQTINNFDPEHVIDLHESVKSVTEASEGGSGLGNLLIYGNSYCALDVSDITDVFNAKYKLSTEQNFGVDTNAPSGSFNNYYGGKVSSGYVFTIETSRKLDYSRRVEQQLQLLDIFFNTIWS